MWRYVFTQHELTFGGVTPISQSAVKTSEMHM